MNAKRSVLKNNFLWQQSFYHARKKWYLQNMVSKLLRYKYGIIIAVALLFPTINTAFAFLIEPFVNFLTQSYDAKMMFFFVGGVHLFAIGWAISQKEALAGYPFRHYFAALPLSAQQKKWVDIKVLFTSNIFLWILLFIALGLSLLDEDPRLTGIFLRICYLIISILLVQTAILLQDKLSVLLVFIIDALIPVKILLPFLNVLLIIFLFILPIKRKNFVYAKSKNKIYFKINVDPFLKLQFKTLFLKNQKMVVVRCAWVLALIALIFLMTLQHVDLRFIYGLMVMLYFVLSGFFVILQEEHKKYACYFRSLPVAARYWVVKDTLLMVLLGGFLTLPIFMFGWITGHYDLYKCIFVWISLLPFSVLLCMNNVFFNRYGMPLSFSLSTVWIYLAAIIG